MITPGQHLTCRILVVLDLVRRYMPPERQVVGLGSPSAFMYERTILSFWALDGKLKDAKQSYVSYAMVRTIHTGIHYIDFSKEFTLFQVQTTTSNCSGISRRGLNTRLYEHIRHDIQHVWPDDESKCFGICGSYFHV